MESHKWHIENSECRWKLIKVIASFKIFFFAGKVMCRKIKTEMLYMVSLITFLFLLWVISCKWDYFVLKNRPFGDSSYWHGNGIWKSIWFNLDYVNTQNVNFKVGLTLHFLIYLSNYNYFPIPTFDIYSCIHPSIHPTSHQPIHPLCTLSTLIYTI